jgi:Ca2+/Na+ antiporter
MTTLLALLAIVLGLVLLEGGAERFTAALVAFAMRLRAPESVVGLLTAGGEWEELVVVALALAGGHSALAVGNIIGSCIANLLGSMPLGLLGPRPLRLDRSARVYAAVMLAVTALASAFLVDGSVEPVWGGLLVAVFGAYVVSVLVVIRRGWLRPLPDDDGADEEVGQESTKRLVLVMIGGLAVLALGAELVVVGSVRIAEELGVSDYAIGATVVAIGTTLPDKAISLVAGLRGRGGVVTSNATGSNIFLLTLVLGLGAAFTAGGLRVDRDVARIDAPLLLLATALVAYLFRRRTLHRLAGVGLLACYVAYVVLALVRGA